MSITEVGASYDRIARRAQQYLSVRAEHADDGDEDSLPVARARLDLAQCLVEAGWQPSEQIYLGLVTDTLRLNSPRAPS